VLHNPSDSVSLKRIINVPTRGIGPITLRHLEEAALERGMSLLDAARHAEAIPQLGGRAQRALDQFCKLIDQLRATMASTTVTDLTQAVIEKSGYRTALEADTSIKGRGKLENVDEMSSATQEYEKTAEESTLAGFLEGVALLTSADALKEGVQAVTLMTLHSAKGLEFPVVFIAGMEEGLLPFVRSAFSDNPMELEEERRLCYVGITRAKERLFLTSAEVRTIFGRTTHTMLSRFVQDIPQELIDPCGPIAPRYVTWEAADRAGSQAAQQILQEAGAGESPFRAGDKVRHASFGDGMVVSISGTGEDLTVSVAFPAKGIKKLAPQYANLEKLG